MTLRLASEEFVDLATVRADARCACVTANDPSDADLQLIIDQVSDDLTIVTGGAISGRQAVVARPCRHPEGCSPCGCCGLDAIPLGDLRPTVTAVKVDGTALTGSEWWLHWNGVSWMIARLPNATQSSPPLWPSSQHRWKADTEDNTFSIAFTQGIHVDSHAIEEAALEAICDRVQQLTAHDKELRGVTSIQLGGATAQVDEDRLERIRSGEIGPATRYLMGVMRPDGRRTSEVWAPELKMGWDLHLVMA